MPKRIPQGTSYMMRPICTDEPQMTCGICQAKFECTHFLDEYRRMLKDRFKEKADYMFQWALETHRQNHQ